MKFEHQSYIAHVKNYDDMGSALERIENDTSIDYWRHEQMYKTLTPLLDKDKLWLTIGDGIGTDANWLLKQGMKVKASDIADTILKMSEAKGYIDGFFKENAEYLSFKDESLEYVLCKEAYHHFPRPYIALYEMIRVASKAVVLIEPNDIGIQWPFIIAIKNVLDRFNTGLINSIWKNRHSFETVGNYVYKISEREMEKVAMGINLPVIAFKGFNDYFSANLDLGQPHATSKKIFNFVKSKIARKNFLCNIGLVPFELITTIIFKQIPSEKTLAELKRSGYKIVKLKRNPYLNTGNIGA